MGPADGCRSSSSAPVVSMVLLRASKLVLPMCVEAGRAMAAWLPCLEVVAELGFEEVGVTELGWWLLQLGWP